MVAKPPLLPTLLFGAQWFAVVVPSVLILGKVVAGLHYSTAGAQIVYLQKVFFVAACFLAVQLFWGHRLPLVGGLMMAVASVEELQFEDAFTISLPIMLGIMISFLPETALNSLPPVLRPVLGNGFVVGMLAVLFLQHLVYGVKTK